MCWCPGALAGPAPGYQAPPQLLQLQMLSSPNLSLGVNAKTHTYKDRQTQRHNHTQKYTQLASTTTVVAAAPPPDFPHPTSPPSRLLSRRLLQPPACRQQGSINCMQGTTGHDDKLVRKKTEQNLCGASCCHTMQSRTMPCNPHNTMQSHTIQVNLTKHTEASRCSTPIANGHRNY